jgi:CubicO group peptidase (beta-lactamase class C family)
MLFMFLAVPLASAADPGVEQRIRQVESGLLPPVLFKGEAPSNSTLSDRMQALHIPGVSVAVIHRGKIEWARGFGVTQKGGPPVDPHTLFQAASVSKVVAAIAVMKLVQADKIDLGGDANRYLKVWKIPSSQYADDRKVTPLELLTHTSGITENYFPGYVPGAALPTLLQMLNGEPPANNKPVRVDILPGSSWKYSGGNFLVVQQLLNDVAETDFQKLATDSVLVPFGMRESTFAFPLPAKLASNAAIAYRSDGEPVVGGPRVHPESATAGLWSTPSDLAKLAIGVQRSLSGKNKRVISPATARVMLTPVSNQQAIGFVVGGDTDRKYFNHGGVNFGYRCLLVAYQDGDGVAVMTNSDNGDELIHEIVRTVAYEYDWPDYAPPVRSLAAIDPASFDRYQGAYRFASGAVITFWRTGTQVHSLISGQPIVPMYPSSEQEYFLKSFDARWVFSMDGSQKGIVATLYQNGQEQTARRVDDQEGRIAVAFAEATERRIKDQTASPASEAALRRLISGLASGMPDYHEMVPAYAEINRRQLPTLQGALNRLGAIESIVFKSVGAAGQDVYDVTFEHGSREFRILLEPDGRVHAAEFSP